MILMGIAALLGGLGRCTHSPAHVIHEPPNIHYNSKLEIQG